MLAYSFLYANRHWLHWPLPVLVTSYVADVLALPLLLSAALWLMRHIYFGRPDFSLPVSWIVATWAGLSLWFELLLPRFRLHATADGFDVLAYALGGLIFWRWLNSPASGKLLLKKNPTSTE
jgi:hypothetical protein